MSGQTSCHRLKPILMVEDDPDQRLVFEVLLRRNRYPSIVVSSPAEAWKVLEESEISLLLTDVMLPGETGLEFVRNFRQIDPYKNTPVIIFTAGREDLEREALEIGADIFTLKKDASEQLMKQIELLLLADLEPLVLPD